MSVDRGAKGDSRQRRALQKLTEQIAASGLVAGNGLSIDPTTNTISISLAVLSGLAVSASGLQVLIDAIAGNMLVVTSAGLKVMSPLTSKGDIFVYGTANDKLPVGADGSVLIADSTQPLGLRYEARLVTNKVTHTFAAVLDSQNGATANTDAGVQFLLMPGDRPLRVKRISLTVHGRPNTAAASASTTGAYWALAKGRGILSTPETAITQNAIIPQCLDNRRVASSALLSRSSNVDLFSISGMIMRAGDNRGYLGLFPEPATGATRARMLYNQMDLASLSSDTELVEVMPGESLIIQHGALFNATSGVNLNGYIVWEEDEVTLAEP